MRKARGIGSALAVLVVLAHGVPSGSAEAKEPKHEPKQRIAPAGKSYAWNFQADTLGLPPAHAMVFGGNWQVLEDSTGVADSASVADSLAGGAAVPTARHLSQLETEDGVGDHYLTFTRPRLGDMDASVRFRIRSGEIDPSAGLMFQMDPKGTSGYLVRVSGKSGELAFHYLLLGKRRDVKFAKIPELTPGTWHTLAVQRRRSLLRVFYDGKERMMVRDDRFSDGTVGVWTEDDSRVDFADLTTTAR